MVEYWLDSDVLIQAKNGPYGFDIVPGFWTFIDEMSDLGKVRASSLVYDELVDGGDELAEWVRSRQERLFVEPDQGTQVAFTPIAEYVLSAYEPAESSRFLDGADPWSIAHAVSAGGVVVTREKLVVPESKKVKIPNVAAEFGVVTTNEYSMLRELGARFTQ